jgi:pyridine nucleotide-disulfide oxidoreductase family protein
VKRLLLLGGGHAHVTVLADLALRPLAGWAVQLVSPYRRQIYSGMLPGWIAGHYALDDCALSLPRLARAAGVSFIETAGIALDPVRNTLHCADGQTLAFDRLSIDTGPMPALAGLPGSQDHALPIRPIEGFVAAWPALAARIAAATVGTASAGTRASGFDLAILGAGAAGVELALAIQHRAVVEGWSALRLTLVGSDAWPMAGAPPGLRRRIAALLDPRGIAWQGDRRAVQVDAGLLRFEHGGPLAFDACLVVTGAAAPAWPRASGLATDDQGFIRVGPTLQSLSHPHILAAGDVAAYAEPRPKSGVFAVKAGPVLAANLRALCEGRAPRRWTPQRRALYLISTGDCHALASWGPLAWGGDWVWRWKDHIDRGFIRRFGGAG